MHCGTMMTSLVFYFIICGIHCFPLPSERSLAMKLWRNTTSPKRQHNGQKLGSAESQSPLNHASGQTKPISAIEKYPFDICFAGEFAPLTVVFYKVDSVNLPADTLFTNPHLMRHGINLFPSSRILYYKRTLHFCTLHWRFKSTNHRKARKYSTKNNKKLKEQNLFSLSKRRKRGDLRGVFEMFKRFDNNNTKDYYTVNQ